uniref:Uncharacterized protein n=1 Tax=Myotis myotis TaxID=51298 RepID=A0A7J7S219_MYOMY|nr:hypothetical protein mMyoMyo1_010053 [Myotis myotis]
MVRTESCIRPHVAVGWYSVPPKGSSPAAQGLTVPVLTQAFPEGVAAGGGRRLEIALGGCLHGLSRRRISCLLLLQFLGTRVNVISSINILYMLPPPQLVFYLENKVALEMGWFHPGTVSGG